MDDLVFVETILLKDLISMASISLMSVVGISAGTSHKNGPVVGCIVLSGELSGLSCHGSLHHLMVHSAN